MSFLGSCDEWKVCRKVTRWIRKGQDKGEPNQNSSRKTQTSLQLLAFCLTLSIRIFDKHHITSIFESNIFWAPKSTSQLFLGQVIRESDTALILAQTLALAPEELLSDDGEASRYLPWTEGMGALDGSR